MVAGSEVGTLPTELVIAGSSRLEKYYSRRSLYKNRGLNENPSSSRICIGVFGASPPRNSIWYKGILAAVSRTRLILAVDLRLPE